MSYVETLPEELQEKFVEKAIENQDTILKCTEMMNRSYIALGELLLESRDKKYYLLNNDSWDEFLADIKVEASRSRRLLQAIRLSRQIEASTGQKPDFSEISESRLTRDIIPVVVEHGKVKNVTETVEILEDAKTLSRSDLLIRLAEARKDIIHKKKAVEKVDIGSVYDLSDQYVGEVIEVMAIDKFHYVKLKIKNEALDFGQAILKLPVKKGKETIEKILRVK